MNVEPVDVQNVFFHFASAYSSIQIRGIDVVSCAWRLQRQSLFSSPFIFVLHFRTYIMIICLYRVY